ncbi:MAG: pimelyl-ACP methyl ester esterase BioV [Epsilonproteobacteria bacterium]|nr:pimelyl-ACP methyl ester esterase BioV [Campylobacterota bacterium]
MQFHSGFSLQNDDVFFQSFIENNDFYIYGFSYGAIKAYLDVKRLLAKGQRVDRLILFSPAFFQTKDEKFKRLQKMAYKKNKQLYLQNFITSCFAPYSVKKVEHTENSIKELEELLEYIWDINGLKELSNKGIKIEVYLGGEDKIIDVESAYKFFTQIADVTLLKKANHFLQGE